MLIINLSLFKLLLNVFYFIFFSTEVKGRNMWSFITCILTENILKKNYSGGMQFLVNACFWWEGLLGKMAK